LGAGRAFEEADTALATGSVAAFFPPAAGSARLVTDFAGAFAGAFRGDAAAFVVAADACFVARFEAGRAGAAFATFFAAFRSAMGAPYPRERVERTYVPGLVDRVS
jgi:hypothetical protein